MPPHRPSLARVAQLALCPTLVLALGSCGGGDDGDGAAATFCEDVRRIDAAIDDVGDATSAQVGEALEDLRHLEAPAAIAEDWATYTSVLDRLAAVDLRDPDPAVLALGDDEEMRDASRRLDRYVSEECGVR
ncbi:MAG TPA: hypothetical protein VFW63_08215 [Acidimicrobiales bacterium]|nr:hypothetical protein [Acidimicrobiales bacterium]